MAKLAPLTEVTETVVILPGAPVAPAGANGDKRGSHESPDGSSGSAGRRDSPPHHHPHGHFYLSHSGWYESTIAVAVRSVIRSKHFTSVGLSVLFVALFIPDIFVGAQVATNTALDVILSLCLVVFAVEWLGLSGTDASYLFSFFFWMDLLGTVSILLDVSYFPLGPDATQPENRRSGSVSDHAIIVRAARAAKLGARAGRLSRVLKLLRFLPVLQKKEAGEEEEVKMAKVISAQLTNMLSTRVSFLTLCVALVLPVFSIFTYPEVDESMSTWTRLLGTTANAYCAAPNATVRNATFGKLNRELARFSVFYSQLNYGPFAVCCGKLLDDDNFYCNDTQLYRHLDTPFSLPDRKASLQLVSHRDFQVFFDLSIPRQYEAIASTGTILFIILVMCSFSLLISSNMTVVVLNPLERMLAVVRGHCMQIFKYSNDLRGDDSDDSDTDKGEDFDENEKQNEFAILEKVIVKLSAVASLFTTEEPAAGDDLNEDQLMTLNWMQGAAAVNVRRQHVGSKRPSEIPSGEVTVVDNVGDMNVGTWGCSRDQINALDTWFFDSQPLSGKERVAIATYIILNHPRSSWTHAHVPEEQVIKFVGVVESKYLAANPFHNFAHALDVLYTLSRFMQLNKAESFVQDHAPFWLSIACIAHDVGHIAVNNQFLIETSHELALKYNDRSPLENMHCATLFQVATEPEANIFKNLPRDVSKELRNCIIGAILHTDMMKHNELIKEVNMLYQMNSDAFDAVNSDGTGLSEGACEVLQEPKHTQLVANIMLHAADINNPMKPWPLASVLAYLCIDEFFAQGDLERAAGLPVSMLNDREKVNKPNSQVGFIEFVIAPMVEPVCSMFPMLAPLAENLAANIQTWSQRWVEESRPAPEAVAKVDARVAKVADKLHRLTKKIGVEMQASERGPSK